MLVLKTLSNQGKNALELIDSLNVKSSNMNPDCRTNYEEINDIFNAAVNASMGCDSSQISALFFLAYANCENNTNLKIQFIIIN